MLAFTHEDSCENERRDWRGWAGLIYSRSHTVNPTEENKWKRHDMFEAMILM